MKRHHPIHSLWMKTMNRCPYFFRSLVLSVSMAWLGSIATLAPLDAQAQLAVRQFPAAAKRGALTVTAPPAVLINGTAERLAPGIRIRGTTNTLVMSASLAGQTVLVNYVRDPQGMIREIWILNEAEAREERKGMEPVINFNFESSGDKPKTDDGKTPFDQLPKYPKQP